MKIVPNYLSVNNNYQIKNKQTSFGNMTEPTKAPNTNTVQNVTPDYHVTAPIAYSHIEDIKLPNNLTAHLYKLANGQQVAIVPKKGTTIVKSYVNTGSLNEPDNVRGISHYIEHNLFNGSEALGDKVFFEEVNKMGAETNASTSFSVTDYYIQSQLLDDTDLENKIRLHAGMLQTPKFLQEKLDKEKKIVNSEINMYQSNEYGRAGTLTLKNLFNIKSNALDLVAGSTDNINALTRNDVINYFNNNYYPANTVTVITGETTPEEAMPLVAKYFNSNKTPQGERHYEQMTPTQRTIRQDLISNKKEGGAFVTIGFAGPENNNSKDKAYLRAVNQFLFEMANSRIKNVNHKYSTNIFANTERLSSRSSDKTAIFVESSLPENNIEPMLKELYSVLGSIATNPPTESEFNAIKTRIKKEISQAMQSSYALNYYIGLDLLNGDRYHTSNYNDIIENMTLQDFINTAKKYYDLNKAAITIVHPKGTKPEEIQQRYEQAKNNQVTFRGKNQISFSGQNKKIPTEISKIREYQTPNNFNVSLQDSDSDVVNYRMSFLSNKIIEHNPVIAEVLNDMLQYCGTAYRDKDNLAGAYDINGIDPSISAHTRGAMISADFPVDKTDIALSLFRENILTPQLTQELFEQSVQRCLDAYKTAEPSAYEKYNQEIYRNTPSGMSKEECIKQLSQIKLADVINLYNNLLSQGQGQIVVTGPFSRHPELVNSIYNSTTSYHTVQPKDITLQNIYTPTGQTKVYTQETNKNQAEVLEGFKFKKNGNAKDEVCIELLNHILGGSSSSRLFTDLREKRHLAYSVRSSYREVDDLGVMTLSIETTTNNTETGAKSLDNIQKSIEGFNENINKISSELVSVEELETAKKALKNSFLEPNELEAFKNCILADNMRNPYGAYYMNEKFKLIDTITPEDILNTAKYVFKDKPIYSISGTKEAIDANKDYLKTLGEYNN